MRKIVAVGRPLRAGAVLVILATALITCSPTMTGNSFGSSTPTGMAIGVAIDSSSAIDISGWTGATNGTTTYGAPDYWQNGMLFAMTVGEGSYFSAYWGTVDSGKNFYVAGAVGSSTTASIPVCWENGAMTSLNTGSSNSYGVAYSVAIAPGGTLYIVGAVGTSSYNLLPCYWVGEGGAPNLLQLGSTYSSGFAVSVTFDSNGNAYFAGAVAGSNGTPAPCYWAVSSGSSNTAGTFAALEMNGNGANTYGYALNIGVYGTTTPQSVYISGVEGESSSINVPCYWSGSTSGVTSTPTDLSLGSGNTSFDLNWGAMDSSGDFYLVGDVGSSSTALPCFWEITSENQISGPTILPTGSGNYGGEAYGIAFDSSTTSVYISGAVG